MKTLLIIFLAAVSARAETNFFALLDCGRAIYTNATISHVTPAYVTVIFDGGIAQVPWREMPPAIREQYQFNSNTASEFLAEKKRKSDNARTAAASQAAAYNKSLTAKAGEVQNIQITAILDETSNGGFPLCSVGFSGGGSDTNNPYPVTGSILLKNLPAEPRNYWRRCSQLKKDIATFEVKVRNDTRAAERADASAPVGAKGTAKFVNAALAERKRANQMTLDAKYEAETLKKMQDDLKAMESTSLDHTVISVFPTGQTFGRYEIWNCLGMGRKTR
jgi:hypothetical protein